MRPDLIGMVRDSVAVPQAAASRLIALRLPRGTVLEGAALVSVLGALLVGGASGGDLTLPMGEAGEVRVSPLAYAVVLMASLLLSAAAVHLGGRALGGRGTFDQALTVMVWIDVVALAVQVVQLLAILVLPVAAPLLGLAGIALLFWCLLNFVRVLHGFAGFGRTILALLVGGLGLGLGLAVLLGLAGGGADV